MTNSNHNNHSINFNTNKSKSIYINLQKEEEEDKELLDLLEGKRKEINNIYIFYIILFYYSMLKPKWK